MVNTVALLSVTGLIGSNLLTALTKAHTEGKIKLIVLHRPSSNVALVPAEVEKRVIDIASASEKEVHAALDGVDILM